MSSPILAAISLPDYFYFVFAICVIVSFCIVVFYAKRHPVPHFRPKKSDVWIVSFLLLFASGGIAFLTSGAFDTDFDKDKLQKKLEDAQRMANVKGSTVEEELGLGEGEGGAGQPVKPKPIPGEVDLPDDAPPELRELMNRK